MLNVVIRNRKSKLRYVDKFKLPTYLDPIGSAPQISDALQEGWSIGCSQNGTRKEVYIYLRAGTIYIYKFLGRYLPTYEVYPPIISKE